MCGGRKGVLLGVWRSRCVRGLGYMGGSKDVRVYVMSGVWWSPNIMDHFGT